MMTLAHLDRAAPAPLPPAAVAEVASHRGASFASDGFVTSADGTRIHQYTVGEGSPALVCCDGLGCDGYVWKYIVEEFSPRHRVVRFHYRGHGSSDKPADPKRMRIADLCDDLLAVMDAQGLEKAVLLGHSVGAQVILEFHRRHPERVIALVPACGTYGRVVDTFKDSAASRLLFPFLTRFVRKYPEIVQKAWGILDTELAYFVATHTDVNGELVKREDFRPYLAHLSQMDVQLFFNLAQDAGENDNLRHLDQVDVPTLVIAGERDGFTPHWLSTVMHARIRGSELLTIPGGTHTAPIEMPELVTLRLRRWLEERVLPGLASHEGTKLEG
jgi:pimeloyl-ACP methyl ester carboxylesterase